MSKTGIFGKHPAFGDFIGAGMSKPMQVKLEEWLGAVLPRVRDNLGDVWQPFYDIALPLRFWVGEAALPRDVPGPIAGVMVFSHDKVGRRFPLVALSEAGRMPPPTVDPDQRWYDQLQAMMLEHDTPETAGELSDMLTLPPGFEPAASEGGDPAFWAVHNAGRVAEMLANVAATDHRRAARPRSYWWCAGDRSRTATFHTLEGWPQADVFQWLLAGNPGESEPEPEPALPPVAAPLPVSDAFLATTAIEAATDMDAGSDPWATDGAPKVPSALYAPVAEDALEELPEDGPQSPFSLRETREDDDTAEVEPPEADAADTSEELVDDADEETVHEDGADDTQGDDQEDGHDNDNDVDAEETETEDEAHEGDTAKPGRDALADEAE